MNHNTPTPVFTFLITFLLCTLAASGQVASEPSTVAADLYGTWVFKTEGSFEKIKPSVMTRLDSDPGLRQEVMNNYINRKMEFSADGNFVIRLADGRSSAGRWSIAPGNLLVTQTSDGTTHSLEILMLTRNTLLLKPVVPAEQEIIVPELLFVKN